MLILIKPHLPLINGQHRQLTKRHPPLVNGQHGQVQLVLRLEHELLLWHVQQ